MTINGVNITMRIQVNGILIHSDRDVRISWIAPTTSEDGSALSDLAGFEVHYGTTSGVYTNSVDVANPEATSYTFEDMASGTYYFSVRAYDEDGAYSEYSAEVSVEVP